MKKYLALVLSITLLGSFLGACQKKTTAPSQTADEQTKQSASESKAEASHEDVATVIQAAEKLSNKELFEKAVKELDGKTMYGIGTSSRGKNAAENFIKELKKIKPDFSGKIAWSQPKNNSIFEALTADTQGETGTYAMTMLTDGLQVKNKLVDTGLLLNYIPKDFAEAKGVNLDRDGKPFLNLLTVVKTFMSNNQGERQIKNFWDLVAKDSHPLFMGVNSETIGKTFLYMLTNEKYANLVKYAFDKLSKDQQAYFQPTIDAMQKEAKELGLEAENAAYGLAWVKLWCEQYNKVTDDGPICKQLVSKSAVDEVGLLVYSKLRAVEESAESSVKNVDIVAYQDDYVGIGGYSFKNYLMIPKTSPLPWSACALIAHMTTYKEGFQAWGKDIGSYATDPAINQDHSKDGVVDGKLEFPAKNDRGIDWWINEANVVVEEPEYLAKVAPVLSDVVDGWLKE